MNECRMEMESWEKNNEGFEYSIVTGDINEDENHRCVYKTNNRDKMAKAIIDSEDSIVFVRVNKDVSHMYDTDREFHTDVEMPVTRGLKEEFL